MKVLITGSNGFVGKNLTNTLMYDESIEILNFNREHSFDTLEKYCQQCDFVIHLAGVNRTENNDDFYNVNEDLTSIIIKYLEISNNIVPLLITSSIQSDLDNDYGKSKRAGENLVEQYGKNNNVPVYIYKLPNLFGKWSKPFYNSVIATWCHSISRSEPIQINDRSVKLSLVYIDDLINAIISNIKSDTQDLNNQYYSVSKIYESTLGNIADTLLSFKESRSNLYVANMEDELTNKLYSTYLAYLPTNDFKYDLLTHSDERGSFTELLKSNSFGQVSVNVAKGHETKGYHWHHSKNEKFIVVKGRALIKFRSVLNDEVIEYIVSDEKFEVVDIPTGYVHTITNLDTEDLITIMWVNEPYDPNNSDTYSNIVEA